MLMEAIAYQVSATDKDFPEVSIIMPCLNEADTLAACIGKAKRALNEQKIAGEINGWSLDNGDQNINPLFDFT